MLFLQDINQKSLVLRQDNATNIIKCCKVQKKLTNIEVITFEFKKVN